MWCTTWMMWIGLTIALVAPGVANDWPQYAGPAHDRTSNEVIGRSAWPAAGPAVVWKRDTPRGFSSFAVADGVVYTLILRDGEETCVALLASDGSEFWAASLAAPEYDGGGDAGADDNQGGDGPRSTPAVQDGRVYVFDAQLVLTCLEADSGESLWRVDLGKEHDGQADLRWQNAASPLLDGGRVFVAGGGAGETFLAFDPQSGEVLWSAGSEQITHATPIAATLHGKRQIIHFVRSGLVALDPETGAELWRAPHKFNVSTAASPVVHEDIVYCSAGYGVGASAYRIAPTDDGFSATLVWHRRNQLMNHWSTPVCKDGYLYGMFSFKKYGTGPLLCVDLTDGSEVWEEAGFGPGNVILVGDLLVALSDAGTVHLVEATPKAYTEIASAAVVGGKCWSTPSFSDGQLYVRSTTEGVRLDLSTEAP
jgi:outer membrane protein assembly factor BamB